MSLNPVVIFPGFPYFSPHFSSGFCCGSPWISPGSRGFHGEVVLSGPHREPRGGLHELLADGAAAHDGGGSGVHAGLAPGDEGEG